MDSSLLAAIIGPTVAFLVAAGGAVLRARSNLRTAARLIYAELTRNSAAVMYFRQTGHWAAPALPRAAWDEYGATIARRLSSEPFEAVRRGYEALEIVPVLTDDSFNDTDRDRLLGDAVAWLVRAISTLGHIAHISDPQVQSTIHRLTSPSAATPERPLPLPGPGSGIISLAMQEALVTMQFSEAAQPAPPPPARPAEPPVPALPPTAQIPEPTVPAAVIGAEAPNADYVVCDAQHKERLHRPVLARWTGQPPTSDPVVNETYEALAAVTAFGRQVLERDPLVKRPLTAVVHYGRNFNNGWWDGEQLVLGDGDGMIFQSFSRCTDLIAGEVWHGVAEMQRYFGWEGENGSLRVSLCDVFGQLVKQHARNQTVEEADWVVGAGLLAPGVKGIGLRSLKAPGTAYDDQSLGKDLQPAHMDDYVHNTEETGGPRINSGIPNFAFYSVAQRLGGKAWENAGRIWWEALIGEGMREGLLFTDWAQRTADAAGMLYGQDSAEHQAVLGAWDRVGVRAAG
ncbi:hypothetical protein HEK616_28250 [Streptomyces nigrescens]|uniref:Neutral metalloproteinase n=2 Tax=Streptomyces TaxID=1883 RepID=A0ABM7ZSI7_STRNI|nr:M4 family metallopeptidase [Streptomyces nigrescens]MEE4418313.1 M4 family metallopeptidase [Streptomyces sp. DSM 41528]BDM69338.1 hypothetical protein HEK616_28250 [Streptomyces nigrescens]